MTVPQNASLYVLDARTGELISTGVLSSTRSQTTPTSSHETAQEEASSGEDLAHWTVHNWWPMSYSPITGLVYVPITNRGRSTEGNRLFEGNLVAWDPVTQTERWRVHQPIAINSGVLSTAGDLVFQGEGTGEFAAYATDSGRKLWSTATGSAIDGANQFRT
jgi:quinohemoprotein ethanol dehydrogenase